MLKGSWHSPSRRAMAPQAGPTEESRINAWFNLAFATWCFIISLLECFLFWVFVFSIDGNICVRVESQKSLRANRICFEWLMDELGKGWPHILKQCLLETVRLAA